MRKHILLVGGCFLAAFVLMLLLPKPIKAQPIPGLINVGTPGQTAVYVAPHTLGPGTGTNAGSGSFTVVYITNAYITVSYITNLTVYTNNVNTEFVTNEYVSLAFITNLYVSTEYVTNINLLGVTTKLSDASLAVTLNVSPFNSTWTNITGYALTNLGAFPVWEGAPLTDLAFTFQPAEFVHLPNKPTAGTIGTPQMRVKFMVNGNTFGFRWAGGNIYYSTDNSRWVSNGVSSPGTDSYGQLTFTSLTNHLIEIMFSQDFIGVYWQTTNSLVTLPPPTYYAVLMGDSYVDGANGVIMHDVFPSQLNDFLNPYGINVIPLGVGGTGYVATNINFANAGPFQTRLTNDIFNLTTTISPGIPRVDMVIFAGGINDPSTTTLQSNTLYTAAVLAYKTVQTNLPNAKIIVIDSFGPGGVQPSSMTISNAAASLGIPVIYPSYAPGTAWISAAGSGNALYYLSSDNTHPTVLGHWFVAQQLADFVRTNALGVPSPPISYITNLYVTTSYVNTSFITNLYSTTTFLTNIYSSYAYISNITYANIAPATNTWSGAPTNTIDLSGPSDLFYASPTSTSVTGVINKPSTNAPTITLTIFNTSATNETFTPPGSTFTRDGLRQYTITNGQELIYSIKYHPGSGHTNSSYIINF